MSHPFVFDDREHDDDDEKVRQISPDPFCTVEIDELIRDDDGNYAPGQSNGRINVYLVETVRELPDNRIEFCMQSGNRYVVNATLKDFDKWCEEIFYL